MPSDGRQMQDSLGWSVAYHCHSDGHVGHAEGVVILVNGPVFQAGEGGTCVCMTLVGLHAALVRPLWR